MKRRLFFLLLMSAATLNLCCQPGTQTSNGNANTNSNSNVDGVEALVAGDKGDKQVAVSVTDAAIQAFPSPVHLSPSKKQKIRWCTYNNTEDKIIDWVRIEAKPDPGIPDPLDCGLPIIDNSDIDPGDSDCTKWCKAKTPPAGLEYFYYNVIVGFKDGTTARLDPQVIISDGKRDEKSTRNSNANSNRR